MQTQRQIRQLLRRAGVKPQRRLGQCFLIDGNLMSKLVELADLTGAETVLEVGAGTGSLTEELLDRARRVVSVEIDRRLHGVVRRLLGERENLTLLRADALAGKHEISPAVLEAVAPEGHLVANLPFVIATPLVAECLLASYRALADPAPAGACRFDRLTFTVQEEVADRLAAGPGGSAYGAVSVLVALLGRLRVGPSLGPPAFGPRPKVASRIIRIDFDPARAAEVVNVRTLQDVLHMAFTHRRKQIGWLVRHTRGPYPGDQIARALAAAEIDRTSRPQRVGPEQFRRMANVLAAERVR